MPRPVLVGRSDEKLQALAQSADLRLGPLGRTFIEQKALLTRYAARLLGGDYDRARDVVQDTFVKLIAQPFKAIEGHEVEWLITVCHHAAIDVLRRESRMKHIDEAQLKYVAAPDLRPGCALEYAEMQAAILHMINRLPANQQEVVRLKFQNGFSYKEISKITDLSVTYVGVLLHTAVARLRAEFAAQPF